MLIGSDFAGVPVYVTLPVMIPPLGSPPAMTGTHKMDRADTQDFLAAFLVFLASWLSISN